MSYDFSFTRREWWSAIAGAVLLALLMFAFGFVSGALWLRGTSATADQAPAPATAPTPAAPVKDAAPQPSSSAAASRAAADTRGC